MRGKELVRQRIWKRTNCSGHFPPALNRIPPFQGQEQAAEQLLCWLEVFEECLEAARLVLYQNAYVAGEVPYGEVIRLFWRHGDDFPASFA
jgi:hypothetical protein